MESIEELEQEIASLAAHLDAATHRLLQCIRLFHDSKAWCDQGALSCAHWLTWRVGWDPATARERVRVARALGKLPVIDKALRLGRLSYSKVRAITRVATPENEWKLLDLALFATGAQLERICRGFRGVLEQDKKRSREERSVRSRQLVGGMVKVVMVLEPDEADLVIRAVERARQVRAEEQRAQQLHQLAKQSQPAQQLQQVHPPVARFSAETWPSRADGAVTIAESFLAGHPVKGNGGARFQVMVHLDQEVLAPDGNFAATLEDGSRVSAETFRRVACDCGLVAVGHDGEALNIGRRTRTIPPAIRRALMLRDHGCAFPGCTHAQFLHAHHVQHWLHGGKTSMENLVMLCTFHHRMVHEGGWKITAVADGVFVFRSPRGKLITANPLPEPLERSEDAVAWLERSFHPEVNRPLGDGKHPDYALTVDALLDAG